MISIAKEHRLILRNFVLVSIVYTIYTIGPAIVRTSKRRAAIETSIESDLRLFGKDVDSGLYEHAMLFEWNGFSDDANKTMAIAINLSGSPIGMPSLLITTVIESSSQNSSKVTSSCRGSCSLC